MEVPKSLHRSQHPIESSHQFAKSRTYSSWITEREKHFISMLEVNPRIECIDLGCGTGEFTLRVQAAIGCNEIYGVDMWKQGLTEAKKLGINALVMDLNAPLGFVSEVFDVAVTNQVIEHLTSPEILIGEIFRILKPGGYLVVSTENLSSWDNLGVLVLGITPFSMQFRGVKVDNPFSPHAGEKVSEDYPIHTRIFTFFGLKDFIASFGFRIEKAVGSGHIIPFGSRFDKWHTRFITIKARKPS